MTVAATPPSWREDEDHGEVIDTLLAMAEAEHKWGDSPRALHLLDQVERIVGPLPEVYQRLHSRCRRDAGRPALA